MEHEMNTSPVTLFELKLKFKKMIGLVEPHTKIEYSIIPFQDQFKIVGFIIKYPDISTFTLDLTANIPRRFINTEMPTLVESIKESFSKFTYSSYKYTTPFENHAHQTIFYCLMQSHIRVLETVSHIAQSHPHTTQHITQPLSLKNNLPFPWNSQQFQYHKDQSLFPPQQQSQTENFMHHHNTTQKHKRKRYEPIKTVIDNL